MISMNLVLIITFLLFSIGIIGVLIRRNIIIVFMCIELMLNAANLNLVAFTKYTGSINGQVFALLTTGLTAAEVAIGLSLVIILYRKKHTIQFDKINLLRG